MGVRGSRKHPVRLPREGRFGSALRFWGSRPQHLDRLQNVSEIRKKSDQDLR